MKLTSLTNVRKKSEALGSKPLKSGYFQYMETEDALDLGYKPHEPRPVRGSL
jgi:hypothetical protein